MEWALQTVGTAAATTLTVQAITNAGAIRRRLSSRFADDHATIFTGWYTGDKDNVEQVYAIARCAPSRRRVSPEPDLDEARSFAAEGLRGQVPARPEIAVGEGLVLRAKEESGLGTATCMLWCSGLVELRLPVRIAPDDLGPFEVDLAAVTVPPLLLADAVASGWYARLFPGTKARQVKLDWSLSVTRIVQTPNGFRQWTELRFPGRQPGDRGHESAAPFAARHLAPELSSLAQSRPVADTVCRLVLPFVRAAGYRKYDGAVEDGVAVGLARLRNLQVPLDG